MPVRNHFPIFHKLKSGAYSYFWTDKCERLLPKHYKERCLDYMLKEPEAVHWVPSEEKYTYDDFGRIPVQNHPILVKYPEQCNKGLWAGEGIVFCFVKYIKKLPRDKYVQRIPKMYKPSINIRVLYSEILDQWISIPCTPRANDIIDSLYGLDNYILKTHERHLNSKLAMVLRRKMLIALAEDKVKPEVAERYAKFKIPLEEARWVGLSTTEALELAESRLEKPPPANTAKKIAHEKILREFVAMRLEREAMDAQEAEESHDKKPSTFDSIRSIVTFTDKKKKL